MFKINLTRSTTYQCTITITMTSSLPRPREEPLPRDVFEGGSQRREPPRASVNDRAAQPSRRGRRGGEGRATRSAGRRTAPDPASHLTADSRGKEARRRHCIPTCRPAATRSRTPQQPLSSRVSSLHRGSGPAAPT